MKIEKTVLGVLSLLSGRTADRVHVEFVDYGRKIRADIAGEFGAHAVEASAPEDVVEGVRAWLNKRDSDREQRKARFAA